MDELDRARAERRVRLFWYHQWKPPWWHFVLPYIGGDEFGRRSLVWPLHPLGWLVVAYRVCQCSDCERKRVLTYAEAIKI